MHVGRYAWLALVPALAAACFTSDSRPNGSAGPAAAGLDNDAAALQPPEADANVIDASPGGAEGDGGDQRDGEAPGADAEAAPSMADAAPDARADAAQPPGAPCPAGRQAVVRFVIDASGSMCEPFGATTRWQTLRTALLDPASGVIPRLQHRVAFGVHIFDGTIDPLLSISNPIAGPPSTGCSGAYTASRAMGACPGLIEVAPALGNAAAIDAAYPVTEVGGSTPTDKVLGSLVDALLAEPARPPTLIVLATDGQPNDICVGGSGGDGLAQQQAVVAAVDRAASAGIRTAVIGLAGNDPALNAHLTEVAQHGDPGNLAAAPLIPADADELGGDLEAIVAEATTAGCMPSSP